MTSQDYVIILLPGRVLPFSLYLNQARSKPDTVNRPVRTARIFVHHYNSTQYCNTQTVFIYIPLPPRPSGTRVSVSI